MNTIKIFMPEPSFIYLPIYVAASCKVLDKCTRGEWSLMLEDANKSCADIKSVDDKVLACINAGASTEHEIIVGIADPAAIGRLEEKENYQVLAPIITGTTIWCIETSEERIRGKIRSVVCPEGLDTVRKIATYLYDIEPQVVDNLYGNECEYARNHHDVKVYTTNMNSVVSAGRDRRLRVRPIVSDAPEGKKDANIIMTALISKRSDLEDDRYRPVLRSLIKAILRIRFMLTSSAIISDVLFDFLGANNNITGDLKESQTKAAYEAEFNRKLNYINDCSSNYDLFPRDFSINSHLWLKTCELLNMADMQFRKYVNNWLVLDAESELANELGISLISVMNCSKFWQRILKVISQMPYFFKALVRFCRWLYILFIVFVLVLWAMNKLNWGSDIFLNCPVLSTFATTGFMVASTTLGVLVNLIPMMPRKEKSK